MKQEATLIRTVYENEKKSIKKKWEKNKNDILHAH